MDSDKVRADIDAHTPPPGGGYNVVGVDTFDEPGEALFLVDNFPTREEAEAAKADKERELEERGECCVRYYVYGPRAE